jgi:hypothetical protein
MKLGKIKLIFKVSFLIYIFGISFIKAQDKISTVPLINLENLKPSYESEEPKEIEENSEKTILKNKNLKKKVIKNKTVRLIGLDKITAKTSEINITLGDTKKFGFLEIKAIKCGEISSVNKKSKAAYIQVVDLSDTKNEKVF